MRFKIFLFNIAAFTAGVFLASYYYQSKLQEKIEEHISFNSNDVMLMLSHQALFNDPDISDSDMEHHLSMYNGFLVSKMFDFERFKMITRDDLTISVLERNNERITKYLLENPSRECSDNEEDKIVECEISKRIGEMGRLYKRLGEI